MRNKLKVSTKYRKSQELEERIIAIMKDSPEGIFPKTLSKILRENENTIKSKLRKLNNLKIVRVDANIRGLYFLVENSIHGVFSYNMHNVVLSYQSDKINLNEQVKEMNNLDEIIKFRLLIGKKSKKATLTISSDYPFNFSSLSILGHLFQEKIRKICNLEVSFKEIQLKTLELNQDYGSLRIEGFSCVTLDYALAQFKIYQKKKFVREEIKFKIPMGLDIIPKVLNQGIISAQTNYQVDQNKKELNYLKKNMFKLQDMFINFFKAKTKEKQR
jgi:hypothetical protein